MVQSKTELFDDDLIEKAGFFKALSHPARLQILKFLAETKSCITSDISDDLPLGRSTVNQHLNDLKLAGLIRGHVVGVKTNYCLDLEKIEELQHLLDSFLVGLKAGNCKCE